MSIADIIILLLLALFAFGGLRRGFVWELLTVIGLVLGFVFTYYFRADLLDLTMRIAPPGWSRQWVAALAFLAFFLLIYLGFTAIGKYLRERLHKTPLKWPDRILGVTAGALKGAILIGLLIVALDWLSPQNQIRQIVNRSQIVRWGKQAVHGWIRWEPASKRKWVEEKDEIRNEKLEMRKAENS
jgi:membrane protein required for colicin V production